MQATRIVIFAKAPVPGQAKTRLIPALGALGAAQLAARMLAATAVQAVAADLGQPELCATPAPGSSAWDGHRPDGVQMTDQGPGDLGERLARAASRVLAAGQRVLLIGSDCPELDAGRLRASARELDSHDAVIDPAHDGGYALLGLRLFDPSLFESIPWSTSAVAAITISRIRALGWSLHIGDTLRDIDEPEDLSPRQPVGGVSKTVRQ